MSQSNDESLKTVFCPQCRIGAVTMRAKPFLKLYYGQLFTIPNAMCYVCDVCNYSEFDDTAFDLISDMIYCAKKINRNQNDPHNLQSPDDRINKRHTPHI